MRTRPMRLPTCAPMRPRTPSSSTSPAPAAPGPRWDRLTSASSFYSDLYHYTPQKPQLPAGFTYLTANSQIGQTNHLLEVLNCADHGCLNGVEVIGDSLIEASFGEHELPVDLRQVIHQPVETALKFSGVYTALIAQELAQMPDQRLLELFGKFARAICSQQQLNPFLQDYLSKEKRYGDGLSSR